MTRSTCTVCCTRSTPASQSPTRGFGRASSALGKQGPAAVWLATPPWHATTDAEGRFTPKGCRRSRRWLLLAGSDEFVRTSITVTDLHEPMAAEVRVSRRGTLTREQLGADAKGRVRVVVRSSGPDAIFENEDDFFLVRNR
ncbi:MAG: hypothetical protein ABIP94_19375 [Planctomycetota bacterium]